LSPPRGISDPSKLALIAVLGTGGEMRSEWLEAHGEGYSDDVEAVENLEFVGCRSDDEVDGLSLV
jgi:hypothetical protein